MKTKRFPNFTKPFTLVHNVLSQLGFKSVSVADGTLYRIVLVDSATNRFFPYHIRTKTHQNGQTKIMFSEGRFLVKDSHPIPSSILLATKSKISEAVDYLLNSGEKSTSNTIDNMMNSMAPSEVDMGKLGKEMKHLKTNSEVENAGFIPDPRQ